MELQRPDTLPVIYNEQYLLDDLEAVTARPKGPSSWMVYGLCSLSNDPKAVAQPKRRHMLRVRIERQPDGSLRPFESTVISASSLRNRLKVEFLALGVEPYRTYFAEHLDPEKNTYRWGNIEGITFTPDGSRLLCGMRNPLHNGKAIVCLVDKIDEAFDSEEGGLRLADVFAVDLGGRGIADIAWDPVTRGYLIAAAKSNGPRLDNDQPFPPNDLASSLFWWSGHKDETPVRFADFPDMKVEGVCRLGDSRYLAVVTDEGDVSESRPNAQGVLTVMDFTGLVSDKQSAEGVGP